MFITEINESFLNKEKYPIFIILTKGKNPILKMLIEKYTDSPYTHISIGVDPELRYFFSYFPPKFTKETFISLKNSNSITIFVFFVDKNTYLKIKTFLEMFDKNSEKTKYSFLKFVGAAFNKNNNKNPLEQICSSFVNVLLNNAGVNILPDNIKCATPADFAKVMSNNKNNKYFCKIYDGSISDLDIDYIKIQINKLLNNDNIQDINSDKIVFNENLTPELVDRSNYDNFNLFNLFHVYTTDYTLRDDPQFLIKMQWVKDKIEEICEMAGWTVFPYELTLCASFEDLDEFYNHEAPKWVTGFTYGDKVYMKAPHIYPGELYYNIVLHECIHVQIYLNEKIKGKRISREDEEGMAVFFSTPLNKWLQELNHGPNWYYYESAIRVQDDFMRDGMKYVIKKRFK